MFIAIFDHISVIYLGVRFYWLMEREFSADMYFNI